jgi:GNAT superfamily N-acetyltransferase
MEGQRIDVPQGQIAAVVTYLEMHGPPDIAPVWPGQWHLSPCPEPNIDWYRYLFRRIGTEWLWFSRLVLPEAGLAAALAATEIYVLSDASGKEIGLLELDRREASTVEIAFFGLIKEATGTGAARFLMQEAMRLAWTSDVTRVWLHTCSLDHPAAVPFSVNSGFKPYKRIIEIDDDPRLHGALPLSAGRHAPPITEGANIDPSETSE